MRYPSLEQREDCYQSGYRAFEAGRPQTWCPYSSGALRESWMGGWWDAEREYTGVPPEDN